MTEAERIEHDAAFKRFKSMTDEELVERETATKLTPQNIGFIAHVDSGKVSLTAAIIRHFQILSRLYKEEGQKSMVPLAQPGLLEPLGAEFEAVYDENIDKLYEN